MTYSLRRFVVFIALISAASSVVQARKKSKSQTQGSFAYYMLVLSYAPDFCAQPQGDKDPRECGNGLNIGFVVHGLWPENSTTRGPEKCGSAAQVPANLVQTMLAYFPTESLIQHEWATHGTCSGLSVDDYFAAVKRARDAVKIPSDLTPSSQQTMTPAAIEGTAASANPDFPKTAFRVSCYSDGQLEELRVCFNKDISPIACTTSAGECSASSLTLLPVR